MKLRRIKDVDPQSDWENAIHPLIRESRIAGIKNKCVNSPVPLNFMCLLKSIMQAVRQMAVAISNGTWYIINRLRKPEFPNKDT